MVKLTRKGKIAIGVSAFVLCMVLIITIVIVAVVESMSRTELYGQQFSYVDDSMYDGSYVASEGGGYVLMQGTNALTKKYSSLKYYKNDLFKFTEYGGRWGYLNTRGKVVKSFSGNSIALREFGDTYISIGDGELSVNCGKVSETLVNAAVFTEDTLPAALEGFYENAPEGVFVYRKDGEICVKNLNSDLVLKDIDSFSGQYVTVSGPELTTYDLVSMTEEPGLNGYTAATERTARLVYGTADGQIIRYRYDANAGSMQIECGGAVALLPENRDLRVTKANGRRFIIPYGNDGGAYYFDGDSVKEGTFIESSAQEVSGVFSNAEGFSVLNPRLISMESFQTQPDILLLGREEKAVVTRTVEYCYIRAEGQLYSIEDEILVKLGTVINIYETEGEDRIITETGVYDAALEPVFIPEREVTGLSPIPDADGIFHDAFKYTSDGKNYVMGANEFPLGELYADIVALKGTSTGGKSRIFFKVAYAGGQSVVYNDGGRELIRTDGEIERCKLYYNGDIYAVETDGRLYVSLKNALADGVWEEISVNPELTVAVLVRGNYLRTIRLDYHATVIDSMYVSEGITVNSVSKYGFVYTDTARGFQGIIDTKGNIKCRASYKKIDLYNRYAVASLDGSHYSMIDFDGNRYEGVYVNYFAVNDYALMYTDVDSAKLMDENGKTVLSGVYGVPSDIKQYVYDKEEKIMRAVPDSDMTNAYIKFNSENIIRILRIPLN